MLKTQTTDYDQTYKPSVDSKRRKTFLPLSSMVWPWHVQSQTKMSTY